MSEQENICPTCGYVTYKELDDRTHCEVGNPRRPPTIKCLGCGFKPINCTCADAK